MVHFDDLLPQYSIKKGTPTHTRIGSKTGQTPKVHGGKYLINNDNIKHFYEVYYKHIFKGNQIIKHEFLTEKQYQPIGPICVDLDFRYPYEIEGEAPKRQHNMETIQDIIQLYVEKLYELLIFKPNTKFNIFVFQKPHVNQVSNKNGGGETKDGIHLIFGIHMDRTLQKMLRKKVMKEFFQVVDILSNLKPDCVANTIFDEGITNGTTNWQLYGSRKPYNEAYQLVNYWKGECGDTIEDWKDIEIVKVDTCDWPTGPELLDLVSVRKRDNIEYNMKEEMKEEYTIAKKAQKKKRKKSKKQNSSNDEKITDKLTLKSIVEKDLKRWQGDNEQGCATYKLVETYKYVMALSAPYYNDFNKWIRVGWALRNTHYELFYVWILFSAQSGENTDEDSDDEDTTENNTGKFSFDEIPERRKEWDDWGRQKHKHEKLTDRSIMYWLREENKPEWENIFKATNDYWLNSAIKAHTAHWPLAVLMKRKYGHKYICANIEKNIWFEFHQHRWRRTDCGYSLRNKLSTELATECATQCQKYGEQRQMAQSGETYAHLNEKEKAEKIQFFADAMARSTKLCISLKQCSFKDKIMKESKCEFKMEKEDFYDKLDENPHLLGFKNGVYDFKMGKFRDGEPTDYISKSTKLCFYELKDIDDYENIIKEINTFMERLFPNAELKEYMWQHLASTLTGFTSNHTFNIYIGKGSNGKSKLIELMGLILGDYKIESPLSLITEKRQKIGGASPEVAKLRGVRYAVIQEPSKGMDLNEGSLKQYTGGDMISGRELYMGTIYFQPQFKLIVATNNLFGVKSDDDGTWRRIRVCDYISKFVDEPKHSHHFKKIERMEEMLERWKYVFMAMLVEKNKETKGLVKDCKSVLRASKEYRGSQNYLAKFVNEMIEKNEDNYLKKQNVWNSFKTWISENYGERSNGKRDELYTYLDKTLGHCIKRKKWMVWEGYNLIPEDDYDDENVMCI